MEEYRVLLGMPGPNIRFNTAQSCFFKCGKKHQVCVVGADNASWDNMNQLWCRALNTARKGEFTHFAMIHADIEPDLSQDWLQVMLEDMENKSASFISAAVPIKDGRGVTSCGIANRDNPWQPRRRFTIRELLQMPEVFTAADIGYADWPLNHNSGLIVADLRDERFFAVDEDRKLKVWFEFRKEMILSESGEYQLRGESEDWNISRRMWQSGIPSCITRRVMLKHFGMTGYPNWYAWGDYEHDDASRAQWEPGEDKRCLTEPENMIRGWLSGREKAELQRLATGKRVIEFGSYCGKSTVAMAKVAEHVTAVDTFVGVPTGSVCDSSGTATGAGNEQALIAEFSANMERYGVREKVSTVIQDAGTVASTISLDGIGLVFYDADHRFEPTYNSGKVLMNRVLPTCAVTFHDYSNRDPGVVEAVDKLAKEFKRTFRVVDTLAVFDRKE